MPDKKVLRNIEPFNDIFYQYCFYNSFFPVVHHFDKSILPILINDVIVYNHEKEQDWLCSNVQYIPLKTEAELLEGLGISSNAKVIRENLIDEVITSINNNRPVIIWVDCFYIPDRADTYLKKHNQHTLLVYGFNEFNHSLCIVEHDHSENLTYKKRLISFSDVLSAYNGYLSNVNNSPAYSTYTEYYPARTGINDGINCGKDDRSVLQYILTFADNMREKKDLIYERLNSLKAFSENIKEAVSSKSMLDENGEGLLKWLNAIINAKLAERYKIVKLFGEDADTEEVDSIIDNWNNIRANVGRYIYAGIYKKNMCINSFNKLAQIKQLEYMHNDKLFLLLSEVSEQIISCGINLQQF